MKHIGFYKKNYYDGESSAAAFESSHFPLAKQISPFNTNSRHGIRTKSHSFLLKSILAWRPENKETSNKNAKLFVVNNKVFISK